MRYAERQFPTDFAAQELFVDVLLLLDAKYREHLRAEREREAEKEARAAKKQAERGADDPGNVGRTVRKRGRP